MVDAAWEWIKNIFFTALDYVKKITQSIMSEVSSFIGDKLNEIKQWWSENGAAVMEVVKFVWSGILANITMVLGLIKAVFQVVWPVIVGAVQIAWATIKAIISVALDLILGAIQFFSKLFTGDVSGAMNTVKDIFSRIWKDIVASFKGIDLAEIGKNILQGLINGINSMVGAVKKAALGVANAIPEKIKSFLGIHSPSRVLMELGGYVGEGFKIGIDDQIKAVNLASQDMASAAIPQVNGTQANAYAPVVAQAPSPQFNLTLHYNGSGTKEDADNMIDMVSRGLNDKIDTKLFMKGMKR
jgi:phage-related protein